LTEPVGRNNVTGACSTAVPRGCAMFSKVDYIKVNVSDMSRSVAFNRDMLG
jgi:hypothetical protein